MKKIFAATLGVAMSVCVANAQSWKSNSYGLYSYPLTGNTSNVAIGITPTSSTASYKLYVKGATYVNGASTVTGALKTNSSLTAAGSLTVNGKSFLSAVTASGDIYGKSKLTIDGTTYLNGTSTLVGKATLAGGFSASSPCTISSSLTTSSLTVSGAATVKGKSSLAATSISGTFSATGSSNSFQNGLTIYSTTSSMRQGVNFGPGTNNCAKMTVYGGKEYGAFEAIATGYTLYGPQGRTFMQLDYNGATLDAALDVWGKITCHNEIEVAEVLKANQIKAQDINVELNNAADYVFEENYNLRPLSEVESYVKENKHLPGVPSAAEISEKGMSVSQMSNLLLEKVEELTLHMIELEKENKALKAEMQMLKK